LSHQAVLVGGAVAVVEGATAALDVPVVLEFLEVASEGPLRDGGLRAEGLLSWEGDAISISPVGKGEEDDLESGRNLLLESPVDGADAHDSMLMVEVGTASNPLPGLT
jgi:hypothetical protein